MADFEPRPLREQWRAEWRQSWPVMALIGVTVVGCVVSVVATWRLDAALGFLGVEFVVLVVAGGVDWLLHPVPAGKRGQRKG